MHLHDVDWIQEAISALDGASTAIDRSLDFTEHRMITTLRACDPAAVSAALDGSNRVAARPTEFALQYGQLATVISDELKAVRSEARAVVDSYRRDLRAVLAQAVEIADAPQVFRIKGAPTKKGSPQNDPQFTWYQAPVEPGAPASMPHRLFPAELDAYAVGELAGADHALAVSLAALAEAEPASLHLLVARPDDSQAQGVTVHLNGTKPIWVSPELPLHGKFRAGVVSGDNIYVGVELVAKAYAMAQADGQLPALDPATTPLTVRVRQSTEAVSGNPTTEHATRLFADDASLLDELRSADLAVACSGHLSLDDQTARRCRLMTGREQGYVVLGVGDDDRVNLYHPLGYTTAVNAAEFREFFPYFVTGAPPAAPEAVVFTDAQRDHLAAHLAI